MSSRLWATHCHTVPLGVRGTDSSLPVVHTVGEVGHSEKFLQITSSAIRIFGTRVSGPITCQPGLGLSEVRGAVPSQQGDIPNLNVR